MHKQEQITQTAIQIVGKLHRARHQLWEIDHYIYSFESKEVAKEAVELSKVLVSKIIENQTERTESEQKLLIQIASQVMGNVQLTNFYLWQKYPKIYSLNPQNVVDKSIELAEILVNRLTTNI